MYDVLLLPFTKADMIWAYGGEGLRTTISVERYWQKILDDLIGIHWELLPVGEILVFAVVAFGMWIFFRTRTGLSMSAVGKMQSLHRRPEWTSIESEFKRLSFPLF